MPLKRRTSTGVLVFFALALLFGANHFRNVSHAREKVSFNTAELKRLYDASKPAVVLIRAEVTDAPSAQPGKTALDPKEFGFPIYLYYVVYPTELVQGIKLGAGIIITSSGEILTNYHVIENSSSISVTLSNGDFYIASVIGADSKNDLALLKINPQKGTNLQILHLGDSDAASIFDVILAIGHPFGLEWTPPDGIVSGLNRLIPSLNQNPLIQIKSAINPGNSGGPLLNSSGDVIGIVQGIQMRSDGIAFVIPVNIAKERLPALRNPPPKSPENQK